MKLDDKYSRLTHSYLHLRKTVGWIGILLPIVLMLGLYFFFRNEDMPSTISHFYFTSMGDVLVGALCAIALFMFYYTGFDKRDNILGSIAGFFALGVAWFPATEHSGQMNTSGIIHNISAIIFFLCLAAFCLWLFCLTKKGEEPSQQKKKRNMIYKFCGVVIILCLIIMGLEIKFGLGLPFNVIFWGEAVALFVFGLSWLIKGEAFLKDQEQIGNDY